MIKLLEKNRWLAIILTILITIEIFWFSSLIGDVTPGGSPLIAISYHFIVFFLFAFFLFAAIKGKRKIRPIFLAIVLIVGIANAILDEWYQSFIPMRDSGVKDVLIDSLGIITAILIYSSINKKLKDKTKFKT